ncbi:MAG TPA: hypothetical protein VGL86_24320 [Polyangia bacterium]|jgi:hypothetical protein
MSIRTLILAGAVVGLAACSAEGTDTEAMWTPADEANLDAQPAQACTPGQPDPRACDPSDTKKTTVCHIPPGNPANEHTICVGNAAVPAHLAHGDHLGSCCDGDAGDGGTSGNGGNGGSGGGGGSPVGTPAGGGSGTTGTGPIG